jgi:hypothetical protein
MSAGLSCEEVMTDTDGMPDSGEVEAFLGGDGDIENADRAVRGRSVSNDIEPNTRTCRLIANCDVVFLDRVYSRQSRRRAVR